MRLEVLLVYSLFLSTIILFIGAGLVFQEYWTKGVVYCWAEPGQWFENFFCGLKNTAFKGFLSIVISTLISASLVNFFMGITGGAIGIAFGLSGGGDFVRLRHGKRDTAKAGFAGSSTIQSLTLTFLLTLILAIGIFFPIVATMDVFFNFFPMMVMLLALTCFIIIPTLTRSIKEVMRLSTAGF